MIKFYKHKQKSLKWLSNIQILSKRELMYTTKLLNTLKSKCNLSISEKPSVNNFINMSGNGKLLLEIGELVVHPTFS